MKKLSFIILCLLFAGAAIAQDRVNLIRTALLERNRDNVLVAAHRGDWRNFPENSLEGIDNAIQMGVDIVEIDIQRTKDGVLILMHDTSLNRTTTGKGKVADCTMDYIRSLRLKSGNGIRTAQKVPTLEEALLHAKGRVMLNLDKADRYFDEVYALLQKTGTTHQIIMKGGKSPQQVKEQYGRYLEEVIYMPIVNLDKEGAEQTIADCLSELQPVAFEFLYVKDTNPLPAKLKKQLKGKSLIWYNTLWDTMAGGHDDDCSMADPDKGYGYLIDTLGARIIQTDRPQYLLDYLRKHKLHD